MVPASPQLAFVARLARLRPTADDEAQARALSARGLDWERVVNKAVFGGVAPLVDAALSRIEIPEVPGSVRRRLREARRASVTSDLAMYHAWLALARAFEERGIRAVTFKGFHVVLSIYRELGLRPVGDLDLLVTRRDLPATMALLEAQGYALRDDWRRAIQHVGLEHILATAHELSLVSPRGVAIDLHWEAGAPGSTPPAEELVAGAEVMMVEGQGVLVPPPAVAMALLLAHGHNSAWARLRWLVDVAEGMEQLSPADVVQVVEILAARRMEAALANALRLMDVLWARRPESSHGFDDGAAVDRGMLRYCAAVLERERDLTKVFDVWRPVRMVRDRLGRAPTWRAALASAFHPNLFDYASIALPRSLRFGYHAVRPVRILGQALGKGWAAIAPRSRAAAVNAAPVPTIADAPVRRRPAIAALPETPLTFVTAIYGHGPDTLMGGRGRDISYFAPSLVNIANLGAPIVVYCAAKDVEAITAAIAPHFRDFRVIPFALESFEHFERFMAWKREYWRELPINDRNEVLCFLKSYWVQRTIADNPFGHERFFWIDAGLTHHGIFPEAVGGVELLVTAPASRYYPRNRANIFTPALGRALAEAIEPGKVTFCALPFRGGRGPAYARVTAEAFGVPCDSLHIDMHLTGGLFGGHARDLATVHALYARLLAAMIDTRTYTLEEQLFSSTCAMRPELFSLHRFDTWYHDPAAVGRSYFRIFTDLAPERVHATV